MHAAVPPSRVLIVDDARTIRFALREFLERAGFVVAEACDLREARHALDDDPPHAVLLDHHLPDGTSLDLLPEIKIRGLAVIVLTASPTPEIEKACGELGADAFLCKPVDLRAVQAILLRLLHDSDLAV